MPSEWGTFDEDGGFNSISTTVSFFFALYCISIVPSKVESTVNERNLNHFSQEISKFREEVFNKYTLTKTLYESKSKISRLLEEVQKEILLKCGNRTEEYRVFAQVK